MRRFVAGRDYLPIEQDEAARPRLAVGVFALAFAVSVLALAISVIAGLVVGASA